MENLNLILANAGSARLSTLPLAMAYVPTQKWEDIYDIKKGFERGTIFCALDLPFLGKEVAK